MAVYTHVPADMLAKFLKDYDLGDLVDFKGVTKGVENTNYILTMSSGQYVLTLFEKRVVERDLPFFLDFMKHLSDHGIAAPAPMLDRTGVALKRLCDRPAVIVTFLDGEDIANPDQGACEQMGRMLAKMHLYTEDFGDSRENSLGLNGWRALVGKCAPRADQCATGLRALIEDEIEELTRIWPDNLPIGAIHADLFPDNVFFQGDDLSGVIDFYFSCTDAFAYDLAITLNAWAGDGGWSKEKAAAMLTGYQSTRPLSEKELNALPVLLRGAALRFLLTRLYDWLHQVEGAQVKVKDPLVYRELLTFHRNQGSSRQKQQSQGLNMIEMYTDGACSGNPGPGGWGVLILCDKGEEELYGGDLDTTNNRMEMLAAIEGLKATRDHKAIRLYTDSQYLKNGITQWIAGWKRNGWKTSTKKPVKNQDLWVALDEETRGREIDWRWVKGHAGDEGNERADELARRGLATVAEE